VLVVVVVKLQVFQSVLVVVVQLIMAVRGWLVEQQMEEVLELTQAVEAVVLPTAVQQEVGVVAGEALVA
jgi:hypothetical protein